MAPKILIFSIAMGANYSFEVKNIEIGALAFFKHNNSFMATVKAKVKRPFPKAFKLPGPTSDVL